jgi:hypothetical protein
MWGQFNQLELPSWLRKPAFSLYIWMFNCSLEDAAVQDLKSYRNLSEFFRRELKPGIRPLDGSRILVSACVAVFFDAERLLSTVFDWRINGAFDYWYGGQAAQAASYGVPAGVFPVSVRGRRPRWGWVRGGETTACQRAPGYNLRKVFKISHENDEIACIMVHFGMINMHLILATATG